MAPGVQNHRTLVGRRVLARRRLGPARAALASCRLCAHDCGVNRLSGEKGLCRAGSVARYYSAQMEIADEMELVPTFAIAVSGCDLRCAFCITGRESWNPRAGQPLDIAALADRAEQSLAAGARSIMILGGEPTIHLPSILDVAAMLPEDARLVWKTNAHGSAQARELIEGIFDVWLADYKFGNDDCAQRLAKVPDYLRVVRENLLWARVHSDLIVRHLLMPGHIDCCWRGVAEWLATELPGVPVSLRSGYWPGWRSSLHPELGRLVSGSETARARAIGIGLGLNLIE